MHTFILITCLIALSTSLPLHKSTVTHNITFNLIYYADFCTGMLVSPIALTLTKNHNIVTGQLDFTNIMDQTKSSFGSYYSYPLCVSFTTSLIFSNKKIINFKPLQDNILLSTFNGITGNTSIDNNIIPFQSTLSLIYKNDQFYLVPNEVSSYQSFTNYYYNGLTSITPILLGNEYTHIKNWYQLTMTSPIISFSYISL